MKKPLVSLIIPAHNSEKFIAECLDSVIQQTYPNLEVIVVDDASTDKTEEIVATYTNKHERFSYIKAQNKNVAKTRRDGIRKASADLICFVDSDDILDEQYVELLYKTMEVTKTEISACSIETFSGENRLSKSIERNKPYTIESNARSFTNHYYLTDDNKLTLQTIPCKLFKKRLFDNIDYSVIKTNIFEDNFILVQILRKVNEVSVVDDVLYWYRQSDYSISKSTLNSIVEYNGEKLNSVEFFRNVVIEYCRKFLKGDDVDASLDKLCSTEFFMYARMVPDLVTRIDSLESLIDSRDRQIEYKDERIVFKDQQIERILDSKRYRIGNLILKPVSIIRKVFKG